MHEANIKVVSNQLLLWLFFIKKFCLYHNVSGMVDALASKTISWEKETGIEFFYDGVRTPVERAMFHVLGGSVKICQAFYYY